VKMNGIYQFVANADDVNLVGKTIYTTVFTWMQDKVFSLSMAFKYVRLS
jgi:hypothetical protein